MYPRQTLPFVGLALLLAVPLGAGGLLWYAKNTQRPQQAATTLVAVVAGFPEIDPSGASCKTTDEQAGIGGWRKGALCLRRDGRRLGLARRSASGLLLSATTQWYKLGTIWATHLVDSIRSAFAARGAKPIQITGKCPELVPANALEQGAWQGAGFQAILTDWRDQDAQHKLQLEVTSTSFSFCPKH